MRMLICLLVFLSGGGESLAAALDDVFSVQGIAVDVAGDAAAARKTAMARAKAQGFSLLMSKLAIRSGLSRLPSVNAADLNGMVSGLDVEEERVAPTRYRARFGVRFSREAVKNHLLRAGLSWSESAAPKTFVLPVLERDGAAMLWDDANVWAKGWGTDVVANLLSAFEVPDAGIPARPGLSDIKPKGARGLSGWARENGAGRLLLARARLSGQKLEISGEWDDGRIVRPAPLTARPNESQASLLTRGVLTLALYLDDAWKEETKISGGSVTSLMLRIPLADAADWGEVQRRLAKVAQIEKFQVRSINPPFLAAEIEYLGERSSLEAAAAAAGLKIEQRDGAAILRRMDRRYEALTEEENK